MKTRILVVVGAAALVAAAGCSSNGTTIGSAPPGPTAPTGADSSGTLPSPTGSPTATSPTAGSTTGGSRCHTSELAASFTPGSPGAGQRYATLRLTSHARRTCTIYGYGGLQPLDSAKEQLPIKLIRDPGHPPILVRLSPGASVGRTIHWGVVPSGTQTSCPIPAYASIIPPDETDPLTVAWTLGPICGGRIDGVPYGTTL